MTTTVNGVVVNETINGVTKNVIVPLATFGALVSPLAVYNGSGTQVGSFAVTI